MSRRLEISVTWLGGLLAEDERSAPPPEPLYELRVVSHGAPDVEHSFDTCAALEAFIARHHPRAEREALPPARPEDAARLEKVFALLDHPQRFDPHHARAFLAGMLYQWGHAPATVARLRRALGLPPLASD